MKTCPTCFQKFEDVNSHVLENHPQYEIRIVNSFGESMSSVGYFPGNVPDWLDELDGKDLNSLRNIDYDDYVYKRLLHRFNEHYSKSIQRAMTEEGKLNHSSDSLFIKVIRG